MSMIFLATMLLLLFVAALLETVVPEVISLLQKRREGGEHHKRDKRVRTARSFVDYGQSMGNVRPGSAFSSDTDATFRDDD
jgi:hypothetical protein